MIIADIGFTIRITLLVRVASWLRLVLLEMSSFLNTFHLVLVLFVVVVVVVLLLLLDELEKLFTRLHFQNHSMEVIVIIQYLRFLVQ